MSLLKLRDFFYLPLVDASLQELIGGGPGLNLVAGADLRPGAEAASRRGFLPSGRAAFFRDQLQSLLLAHADLPADELCRSVFASLTAYRGTSQQYDDMTLVIVRVT